MIWYSKYLQVYNKAFQATSTSIIEEVRGKLREMNSDSPLVSVVIIAHNEETRILACDKNCCSSYNRRKT
jgi:capsular polysaccharide biosynthesis protein